LLDIDPQKSLGRWHGLRRARLEQAATLAFSDISGWRLPAELERLKRDHDVVLIDSPPHLDTDARVAVRAADIVLVPIQPSLPDVWAAEGTLALAGDERRSAHLVFNRVPPTSRLRDTIEADLGTRRLPLLRSGLGNRAGFAHAFAAGLGITESAPRSTAAAELRALLDELQELTE
jgi:chromosome partitioning protein